MGQNIVEKIIYAHLREGEYAPGREIGIRVDQTLTQDATGTMAYLQFEALGLTEVKTDLSVSYVDHNTVQVGFENADDHRYLQTVAARCGVVFSRAGNGICHQVHLERFGKPGTTLLGSDSHTPTGGGIGQLSAGLADRVGCYTGEIVGTRQYASEYDERYEREQREIRVRECWWPWSEEWANA